MSLAEDAAPDDVHALLREAKHLAGRYYRATGKPLGVTGEVAELEAADRLGIELVPPRTPGYDATQLREGQLCRIQIKGRAVDPADRIAANAHP